MSKIEEFLKELFEIAEREYPIADKLADKIKTDILNFELLENYLHSKKQLTRRLVKRLALLISAEKLSFEKLMRCSNSENLNMSSISMLLILKNFKDKIDSELLFKFIARGSVVNLDEEIYEAVKKIKTDNLKFDELIRKQKSGNFKVRSLSKTLILLIPKSNLSLSTLLELNCDFDLEVRELSRVLLLNHFVGEIKHKTLVDLALYSETETATRAKEFLYSIPAKQISQKFLNECINSRNYEIREIGMDLLIKNELSSSCKLEYESLILKYDL